MLILTKLQCLVITSNANEIHSNQLSRDVYCGDKHTGVPTYLPISTLTGTRATASWPTKNILIPSAAGCCSEGYRQLLPVVAVLFGRCGAL